MTKRVTVMLPIAALALLGAFALWKQAQSDPAAPSANLPAVNGTAANAAAAFIMDAATEADLVDDEDAQSQNTLESGASVGAYYDDF